MLTNLEKKQLYEHVMRDVLCPTSLKTYTPDNVKWVSAQLAKGSFTQLSLRVILNNMVEKCS